MHISRNKRIAATIVAAVAIPATVLSLQPTNAAGPSGTDQTFRLVERESTFKYVDIPPRQQNQQSPPTAGDEFIFTSKLFRAGERVGTLHAVCTITRRSPGPRVWASCVGSFDLRGGRIEVAVGGAISDQRVELAITGGTGNYTGARGTITSVTRGNRSIDTVHLLG